MDNWSGWAVPIDEYPQRGKSIVKTRMKPVILTYLASEDIESFRNGLTSRQLRINRLVRWCYQAYDQGALLTQLDLAVLLNVCDAVVNNYVNEWQKTSGKLLPTRGNIHDLSGAITHKKGYPAPTGKPMRYLRITIFWMAE